LGDVAQAIQQGVLRMDMEVNERHTLDHLLRLATTAHPIIANHSERGQSHALCGTNFKVAVPHPMSYDQEIRVPRRREA